MQVVRFKSFLLGGIRNLYSASSLGVDSYISTRHRVKDQFHDIEPKFKEKMNDFTNKDSGHMVFTEDLKHMVHLVEGNDADLDLVYKMMLKFSEQNKDIRFGSFIFGPVVMRMYYFLDKPDEALKVFTELENNGFFDQLISYQILMDLLLKHNMYQEVIDVFEIVKEKQLHGSRYPKNAVVLVLAACYKMNTPESFNYTKKLWCDLNQSGHYPMRRASTFAASLAIEQGAPDIGLEILTSIKQQAYVTVRNLKVSALSDLRRPDDALPLLRAVLDGDRAIEKNTICEEVVNKLSAAVEKFDRKEFSEEFERVVSQLKSLGHISPMPLSQLLCMEISSVSNHDKFQTSKSYIRRPSSFQRRPGLQDMG